jgi:hypothetical protein
VTEILTSLATALGISIGVLSLITYGVVFTTVFLFILIMTRSWMIAGLCSIPIIVIGLFIGMIPIWVGVILSVITFMGVVRNFSFRKEELPNQLIQKKHKGENLCLTCEKQDSCEDYKRIGYLDICGEHHKRNLCRTCIKASSCGWVNPNAPRYFCNDYLKNNSGKTERIFNNECPLCHELSFVWERIDKDRTVYKCEKCGYKETNSSFIRKEIITNKPLEVITKPVVYKSLGEELKVGGFEKGVKTYDKLTVEYDAIMELFKGNNVQNNLIDVQKVSKTVNEIYGKSLDFLKLANEIYKQQSLVNYETLKAENEELKANLDGCKDTESALYRTLKEAVERNDKTLGLYKKSKDRIDELFGQISLCKDAMMEIRLGLPELLHHQSTDELNKVIEESRDRIGFGQRLLDEYKKQGL